MANRKDMTAAYFKALNLPQSTRMAEDDISNYLAKIAALNRAHDMRKFEIENYWKRATYFWSFQAIAFALLGFLLNDGKVPDPLQLVQLPAVVGAVSGFVGWLSAKGSKYWQENWESHVDALEEEIEGRLTQTIWSNGKRSHSVSRLNQWFMGLITLGWIAVMIVPLSVGKIPDCIVQNAPCILLGLLAVTFGGIWFGTRQDMQGYVLHQDSWLQVGFGWIWSWKRQGNGKEQRQLLLRHTKAKDAVQPDQ